MLIKNRSMINYVKFLNELDAILSDFPDEFREPGEVSHAVGQASAPIAGLPAHGCADAGRLESRRVRYWI